MTDSAATLEPPDDAFLRALTEAQPALRAYCEASLGHGEEAKDAWQRTNMVLWRKSREWQPGTKFLRWALTVARFEVLAVIRDRQRERLVFADDVAELMADAAASEVATHDLLREALAHCIEKLQPRQREVLAAHYVFGHSLAEIAAARGAGLSATKVLLLRVRRSLAECIERQTIREVHP
jgi:RNA polymerase sigma-70 factor (ECF subfamily)